MVEHIYRNVHTIQSTVQEIIIKQSPVWPPTSSRGRTMLAPDASVDHGLPAGDHTHPWYFLSVLVLGRRFRRLTTFPRVTQIVSSRARIQTHACPTAEWD